MSSGRFRVAINGLSIANQTWDDALEWDGKGDEVYLSTSVVLKDIDGNTIYSGQNSSPVIGDVNQQPGRILGGTLSPKGGFRSGDSFPAQSPWARTISPSLQRNWPPNVVWEGTLTQGESAVFISPTIWEWDPGQSMWEGWVDWHRRIDQEFGPKAKEIVTGVFPLAAPVFDAVSLGIQTLATAFGGGPLGASKNRPVGSKAQGNTLVFDPKVIPLTYDQAVRIVEESPSGLGNGIIAIDYEDSPDLRGKCSLFLQVERLNGVIPEGGHPGEQVQWEWRWCSKCQGLYFGPQRPYSVCPAGGQHGAAPSGNYGLLHGAPIRPDAQRDWNWCSKCQGLYYWPRRDDSTCPAGGSHGQGESWNYSLLHNVGFRTDAQLWWNWCSKCQGLYYWPGRPGSVCPEGGTHGAAPSGNYSLFHFG